MATVIIYTVMNVLFSLLVGVAMCRVLVMRSNALYMALWVGMYTALMVIDVNRWSATSALGLIALVLITLLPFACSTGGVASRVIREIIIIMAAFVSDYLALLYHQVVFGYQISSGISSTDSLDPNVLLSSYVVALSAAALCLWVATEVLGSYDSDEGSLSAAVAILPVLWSFALILGFSPWRMTTLGGDDVVVTVIFCLNWVGSLAVALVVQALARREVAVTRHRSRRPSALRGTRHARAEAQATVRRAMEARRLRHALANQGTAVPALAREGRVREADRQLAASQDLARRLARGADRE